MMVTGVAPSSPGRVQRIPLRCTIANPSCPKRNRRGKHRLRREPACREQAIGVRCGFRSYRTHPALRMAEVQTPSGAPRSQVPVRVLQKCILSRRGSDAESAGRLKCAKDLMGGRAGERVAAYSARDGSVAIAIRRSDCVNGVDVDTVSLGDIKQTPSEAPGDAQHPDLPHEREETYRHHGTARDAAPGPPRCPVPRPDHQQLQRCFAVLRWQPTKGNSNSGPYPCDRSNSNLNTFKHRYEPDQFRRSKISKLRKRFQLTCRAVWRTGRPPPICRKHPDEKVHWSWSSLVKSTRLVNGSFT